MLKAPALKMGKYEYRLTKDGELLVRDDFTVLRTENPYELPPAATPGEPRDLKLVKVVKPDLATLTTNDFRAVAVRDTVSGRTYPAGTVSLALAPYELRSFVSSRSAATAAFMSAWRKR